MTREEFKQKYNDLQAKRRELADQEEALKKEYLSFSPFKRGDKVVVDTHEGKVTCFVGEVKIGFTSGYRYGFLKMKKDGTCSAVSAGLYNAQIIEKA